ncbi:MAG TPA: acyloxyacyl hydrolase [Burkholderiales bacterium]|nr:acyloxyacyl hydrolase [Burkholderiales bacterium]
MRIAAAAFALALSAPVAAQEPATLVLGAGATGIFHHNSHVTETVAVGSLEYRASYDLWRGVKPLAGVFAASDNSAYIHAGVYRDFILSSRWIVTPHFSAGAHRNGDRNDLGGALEFQSGVDLFYQLGHGWRLGATLRHVSNGGIYDTNPGIETLAVLVSMPLD